MLVSKLISNLQIFSITISFDLGFSGSKLRTHQFFFVIADNVFWI
jgi:hypothetical protein